MHPHRIFQVGLIFAFISSALLLLLQYSSKWPESKRIIAFPLTISRSTNPARNLWASASYKAEYTVRNISANPIHIDRFAATCSCLNVTPSQMTLSPGEEQRVLLDVDLFTKDAASNIDRWKSSFGFLPEDIDGRPLAAPQREEFSVERAAEVSPRSVRITTTIQPPHKPMTSTLHVKSRTELSDVRVFCDERFASVGLEQTASGQYELTVVPSRDLGNGIHRPSINLLATTSSAQALEIPLDVCIVVREPLEVTPTIIVTRRSELALCHSNLSIVATDDQTIEVKSVQLSSSNNECTLEHYSATRRGPGTIFLELAFRLSCNKPVTGQVLVSVSTHVNEGRATDGEDSISQVSVPIALYP